MKKNITPINTKGQPHGLCEYYYYNGKLCRKCIYINGEIIGFSESYSYDGKLRYKNYHL